MSILVVNGRSYAEAVMELDDIVVDYDILFSKASKHVNLVLFTGGEDITPTLYGDTSPMGLCYYNKQRDGVENAVFKRANALGIGCIGICRGLQLLNVIAGGKMYHDVDKHSGCFHNMQTSTGKVIKVNSLHHQMVIPPKEAIVIGWAENQASRYYGNGDVKVKGPLFEPETVLFPNINSAGVQYHPEIMPSSTDGYKWFRDLAENMITKKFKDVVNIYGKTGVCCSTNS